MNFPPEQAPRYPDVSELRIRQAGLCHRLDKYAGRLLPDLAVEHKHECYFRFPNDLRCSRTAYGVDKVAT